MNRRHGAGAPDCDLAPGVNQQPNNDRPLQAPYVGFDAYASKGLALMKE